MNLLDVLPGAWVGTGDGHYPTIEPFSYRERLTFAQLGDKPVIAYTQRTQHAETAAALHVECGYLRVDGDRAELLIVQPTGFAEVHHGILAGGVIEFAVTALGRSASALPVETVRRRWELAGDRLVVELWMTYGGVIDGHHLRSQLRREHA